MGSHVMFCYRLKVEWLSHDNSHTHHLNFFTYCLHCFRSQCSNGDSTFQEHPTAFHDGLTDLHHRNSVQIYLVPTSLLTLIVVTISILTGVRTQLKEFLSYTSQLFADLFLRNACVRPLPGFCVFLLLISSYILPLYRCMAWKHRMEYIVTLLSVFFSHQVLMIYLFIELIKIDIVLYMLSS